MLRRGENTALWTSGQAVDPRKNYSTVCLWTEPTLAVGKGWRTICQWCSIGITIKLQIGQDKSCLRVHESVKKSEVGGVFYRYLPKIPLLESLNWTKAFFVLEYLFLNAICFLRKATHYNREIKLFYIFFEWRCHECMQYQNSLNWTLKLCHFFVCKSNYNNEWVGEWMNEWLYKLERTRRELQS